MRKCTFTIACTLVAAAFFSVFANNVNSQTTDAVPHLAPFEFHRKGAASPAEAAKVFFRGVATDSPKHFVQHLLLGVCDGPIDTLQKFAECLHVTEFKDGDDSFTFYELRETQKGINYKKPSRVILTKQFNSEDKEVAALQFEMLSTYYGEGFMAVDVAAEGYDGREYQTRIVVAQLGDYWFSIPRCRSSKNFYAIADAMDDYEIDQSENPGSE
ncbi:hypothetical protein OAF42_01020 [Planctomicrobium sp.]|nr:hypothetical protein [Planctomicrobium sp.]MDB4733000.1 hypothetical protein [Planctomicrobium sp.]